MKTGTTRILLLSFYSAFLFACTETVVRHRPLPIPGSEIRSPAPPVSAEQLSELEKKLTLASERMELLYRINAARLSYLEAVTEYQSTGLRILALDPESDPLGEKELFSLLSAQSKKSRKEAERVRVVLQRAISELPAGSPLEREIQQWLSHLDMVMPLPSDGKARVPSAYSPSLKQGANESSQGREE